MIAGNDGQMFGAARAESGDHFGDLAALRRLQFDRAADPTGAASPRPLTLAFINGRFETGIRSPLDAALLRQVAARAGWQDVPAVRGGRLHEIKSCDILQPGPAALTDGVEQLHRLFAAWARER